MFSDSGSLSVTPQSSCAAVSGCDFGRRGVALAPRFQLCVRCAVFIAPAVGTVLAYLCLVPWWHRVRCDACVVSLFDACISPWLGGCFLGLVQRC